MVAAAPERPLEAGGFRHEALLHTGDDGFLAATVPFVSEGLRAGEPTMVMVPAPRIDHLWEALGGADGLGEAAALLYFGDMAEIGANPALIIPAWRDFVAEHGAEGRRLRGIGEPVWPGRGVAELEECHLHECLLNLAFDAGPDLWLLCPYDTAALENEVIAGARRSHPLLRLDDGGVHAGDYPGGAAALELLAAPLPPPSQRPIELILDRRSFLSLPSLVAGEGGRAGLADEQVADLTAALTEVALTSLEHGDGRGAVRAWRDGDAFVVEVSRAGRLEQPLAGRVRPLTSEGRRHGLWMANHRCDLVQLRSSPEGTVVRLHMRRR